uniref:T-cell surface antigen CD2 isoform X2 n=1 Tax=Monopterus albus TaxID=43700 RepID=UPI0009B4074B|nr:T-cell surface antigen CD2-like isoform X2 [Monopterus albus]
MVRMMVKMAVLSTISLLLVCCSVFASEEKCNHNVEEGGTIEVPLDYSMQNIHKLEWMYNDVKIYNGPNDKDGKRKTTLDDKQRQGKVYENGSLKMEKLMKSHKGTYKANYYDNKGKLIGAKVAKVCVFDLVPKPTVKIDCSSSPAKFTCSAKQIEKFNIEWLKNKDVLKNEKKATLTQKAEPVKNGELTCRIYNEAKSMTSEPVTLNCNKAGYTFPEKIWGINSWIIVGCGAGIVVLLIVMVVACFIRAKVKNRMRQKDEEELRLDWANPEQQQYQHPQQQQQQQQHCQPPGRQPHQQRQPQQAGHTGPRQHRSKQHREQRLRAPESDNANPQPSPRRAAQVQAHRPAVNDDEEQPPPLPQPRKTARTPRV